MRKKIHQVAVFGFGQFVSSSNSHFAELGKQIIPDFVKGKIQVSRTAHGSSTKKGLNQLEICDGVLA